MPDLVIFGLFGLAAGCAYLRYLIKQKHMRITHTGPGPVINTEEQEITPNYEESQMQPPVYVQAIEQAPPPY